MVSQKLFIIFTLALIIQRLFELRKSQKNCRLLLKNGGRESGQGHFLSMVMLHTCWLIFCPLEVFLFDRPFNLLIFLPALLAFLAGQALRLLAMHELKERWTARIITVHGLMPVTSGIFRFIRHPNYLGVVLEIAAFPLLHSAYLSAIIFSVLNLWLLKIRISAEENALERDNKYSTAFKRLSV